MNEFKAIKVPCEKVLRLHILRPGVGVCLLLALILASAAVFCAPAGALEAGASKVEITPPLGAPLNGYGERLGRGAVSVHDPLWARSLYLSDGETALFLVTTDLCIMNRELRARVLEYAPDVVPPEHVILTATHTHNGTGGLVRPLIFRFISGPFRPDLLDSTAKAIAQSMREAYQARQRATAGYGTAKQTVLSRNRRVDDGPIDSQIGVLRVDDADGKALAIVANFAAHPTTVGEEHGLTISADYPHYYYEQLEDLADEGCVAMFTNGALGNQSPKDPEDNTGWERTASIGQLLAVRVKEVANRIEADDAALHLGYSEPELPLSIADKWMPRNTVLQTLEIGGLLMTFFPGEPTVEIGLELRRRALARNYDAQFSVGLANDHLLYFAHPAYYPMPYYESQTSAYGPDIAEWFYRQFANLMTRSEPIPDQPKPPPAKLSEIPGGYRFEESGTPYALGFARGAAFAPSIREAYERLIRQRVAVGDWKPESGYFSYLPPFIDASTLGVPLLAIQSRVLLEGLPASLFEELEGLADGARLPFDAVWLLQCAGMLDAQESLEGLYTGPFCTMFASIQEQDSGNQLLIGRNFDWSSPEAGVILESNPEDGHAFLQVGFPWNAGIFTGMNEAGLVLCAERIPGAGSPSLEGPPLALVLRNILENEDTVEAAVADLRGRSYLQGYHVLVAAPDPLDARVVAPGGDPVVREAQNGLLLGSTPEAAYLSGADQARYSRLTELLHATAPLTVEGIQRLLEDTVPDKAPQSAILNPRTRHSVVLEPLARRAHIRLRLESGVLSEPITVELGDAAP